MLLVDRVCHTGGVDVDDWKSIKELVFHGADPDRGGSGALSMVPIHETNGREGLQREVERMALEQFPETSEASSTALRPERVCLAGKLLTMEMLGRAGTPADAISPIALAQSYGLPKVMEAIEKGRIARSEFEKWKAEILGVLKSDKWRPLVSFHRPKSIEHEKGKLDEKEARLEERFSLRLSEDVADKELEAREVMALDADPVLSRAEHILRRGRKGTAYRDQLMERSNKFWHPLHNGVINFAVAEEIALRVAETSGNDDGRESEDGKITFEAEYRSGTWSDSDSDHEDDEEEEENDGH
jgi:hypothetical protein